AGRHGVLPADHPQRLPRDQRRALRRAKDARAVRGAGAARRLVARLRAPVARALRRRRRQLPGSAVRGKPAVRRRAERGELEHPALHAADQRLPGARWRLAGRGGRARARAAAVGTPGKAALGAMEAHIPPLLIVLAAAVAASFLGEFTSRFGFPVVVLEL